MASSAGELAPLANDLRARLRDLEDAYRRSLGPEAPWNEVTQNLGWLLIGTVFSAALLNAGPVTAKFLASEDQHAAVNQFAYGVLLARIPLFLFQAVQAALLPRLARLAARVNSASSRTRSASASICELC